MLKTTRWTFEEGIVMNCARAYSAQDCAQETSVVHTDCRKPYSSYLNHGSSIALPGWCRTPL